MNMDNIVPDNFNGVISMINNNEVIFRKAYGYSNIPDKIENQIDTKFPTASAGKVFISVAIQILAEQGRISLDDPAGMFIKYDLGLINKDVTIRQLLNHTSGIADYFDESTMNSYEDLWKDYPNYRIRKSSDLLPLFRHSVTPSA